MEVFVMGDFANEVKLDDFLKKASDNGWLINKQDEASLKALYNLSKENDLSQVERILKNIYTKDVWYEKAREEGRNKYVHILNQYKYDKEITKEELDSTVTLSAPSQQELDKVYKDRFGKERPLSQIEKDEIRERELTEAASKKDEEYFKKSEERRRQQIEKENKRIEAEKNKRQIEQERINKLVEEEARLLKEKEKAEAKERARLLNESKKRTPAYEANIEKNNKAFDDKFKLSEEEFITKTEDLGWCYKNISENRNDQKAMSAIYRAARNSGNEELHQLVDKLLTTDVTTSSSRKPMVKEINKVVTKLVNGTELAGMDYARISDVKRYDMLYDSASDKSIQNAINKKEENREKLSKIRAKKAANEAFVNKLIDNGWDKNNTNGNRLFHILFEAYYPENYMDKVSPAKEAFDKILDAKVDPAEPYTSMNNILRTFGEDIKKSSLPGFSKDRILDNLKVVIDKTKVEEAKEVAEKAKKNWTEMDAKSKETFSKLRDALNLGEDEPKAGRKDFDGIHPDVQKMADDAVEKSKANDVKARKEMLKNIHPRLNEHIVARDNIVNYSNIGFDYFKQVYGPEGKMPDVKYPHPEEYNDIKLPVPEGLDEDTVTAIMIGSLMRPDRLGKELSGSTPEGNIVTMNWVHIMESIPINDGRAVGFGPVMVQAKREAKAALEKYQTTGDATDIKNMLQTFLDGCAVCSEGLTTKAFASQNAMELLADKIVQDNKFGLKPMSNGVTDPTAMRFANYNKSLKARIEAAKTSQKLEADFDKLSKQEKTQLIEDMLFNNYIAYMPERGDIQRVRAAINYQVEAGRKIGIDDPDRIPDSSKNINNVVKEIIDTLRKYTVSDYDVIMSQPDGKERIRNLYMDEIRKTDNYKRLVESPTKEDFLRNLVLSDEVTSKGITSITSVKLPNESKAVNDKYKEAFTAEIKKKQRDTLKEAYGAQGVFGEEGQDFRYDNLSPENLKAHSAQIDELYRMVDGNNFWGGSKNNNYKNMLTKLKELKNLAAKNAKSGMTLSEKEAKEYLNLAEEVDKLAEKYLDNKTDINSPYAKARVDGVKELRRSLLPVIASVEPAIKNMKEEKIEELFGERTSMKDSISLKGVPDNENPFYGKKYAYPLTRGIPARLRQYSLSRGAGVSVAVMALAASGKYSFEDIMDPEKLHAEKAEAFDKVATAMKNQTPEDQKYLAETMYNGTKAAYNMLDEQIKKIDFNKPNIFRDKQFNMVTRMLHHCGDAEQEMKHCKEEILPLYQKDDPTIKKFEDILPVWSPLQMVSKTMEEQKEIAVRLVTEKTGLDKHAAQLMTKTIELNTTLKAMAEKQKTMKDTHFKDWFSPVERNEFASLGTGDGYLAIQPKLSYLKKDTKLAENLAEELIEGGSFKDTTLTTDMNTLKQSVNNMPDEKKMKAVAENGKFLKKINEAAERLSTKKYKEYDDYKKDCAIVLFGQMYRAAGYNLPADVKTGKDVPLEKYVKMQMNNPIFEDLLKSEKSPGKYKAGNDIIRMAKDTNKLKKIIKESNDKYAKIQYQKNLKNAKKTNIVKNETIKK